MEAEAAEQSPEEQGDEDSAEIATCYWSVMI